METKIKLQYEPLFPARSVTYYVQLNENGIYTVDDFDSIKLSTSDKRKEYKSYQRVLE